MLKGVNKLIIEINKDGAYLERAVFCVKPGELELTESKRVNKRAVPGFVWSLGAVGVLSVVGGIALLVVK